MALPVVESHNAVNAGPERIVTSKHVKVKFDPKEIYSYTCEELTCEGNDEAILASYCGSAIYIVSYRNEGSILYVSY